MIFQKEEERRKLHRNKEGDSRFAVIQRKKGGMRIFSSFTRDNLLLLLLLVQQGRSPYHEKELGSSFL